MIYVLCVVYAEDLITRPVSELEKIITFAGLPLPERKRMFKQGLLLKAAVKANLKKPAADIPPEWMRTAVSVLEEELQSTNTLSDWPCKSFRKIHSDEEVSAALPMKAAELAADCSGRYVTCSVPIDKAGG